MKTMKTVRYECTRSSLKNVVKEHLFVGVILKAQADQCHPTTAIGFVAVAKLN
jgi:hypothetical protein